MKECLPVAGVDVFREPFKYTIGIVADTEYFRGPGADIGGLSAAIGMDKKLVHDPGHHFCDIGELLPALPEFLVGKREFLVLAAQFIPRCGELFVRCAKFGLAFLALRDIADRFDCTDNLPQPVIKRACLTHHRDCFSQRAGKGGIRIQGIFFAGDVGVIPVNDIVGSEDQVDEYFPPGTVERDCVLKIPLSQHLCSRNTGHFLYGMVPGYDPAGFIDRKGCIGKEVDDIAETFLRFHKR